MVLFGSYALWRYAQAKGLRPGVFRIRPFIGETPWHPHLLNGPESRFVVLRDVPKMLRDDDQIWFIRPVEDSKEIAGTVKTSGEIITLAKGVLKLPPEDLPGGSLRHDTALMLSPPVRIQKEWRVWIVADRVVTFSLYKDGRQVVYRPEIDDDARLFAERLVRLNPGYAPAYVMDICRTAEGLSMLETNCLNAAGFYAADLSKLVQAIDALDYTDSAS